MRLLVAEDDSSSRELLRALLAADGHDVVPVCDGRQALTELCRENGPRLAVLDWMMPDMDGVAVCRQLRAFDTERPVYVIMVTSKKEMEHIIEAFRAGADDYLAKPVHAAELQARVRVGARIIELQDRVADRANRLEQALSEVHKLQGLLPICCYCKRIRDDNDYWTELETYVSARLRTEFSHGVCPQCLKEIVLPQLEESRSGQKVIHAAGKISSGRACPLPVGSRSKTVVIIRDDPSSQHHLACSIDTDTVEVISFANAEEAVVHMNEEVPPDLIIANLEMPGIDGWQLCRLLRSRELAPFNRVPILLCSAAGSNTETKQISKELPTLVYSVDVDDPQSLCQAVRSLLKGRSPWVAKKALIFARERGFREFTEAGLQYHGYDCHSVASLAEAERVLGAQTPEIVVLEGDGASEDVEQFFEMARAQRPRLVIAVVIEEFSRERAIDWLKRGADRCFARPIDFKEVAELGRQVAHERSFSRIEHVH